MWTDSFYLIFIGVSRPADWQFYFLADPVTLNKVKVTDSHVYLYISSEVIAQWVTLLELIIFKKYPTIPFPSYFMVCKLSSLERKWASTNIKFEKSQLFIYLFYRCLTSSRQQREEESVSSTSDISPLLSFWTQPARWMLITQTHIFHASQENYLILNLYKLFYIIWFNIFVQDITFGDLQFT